MVLRVVDPNGGGILILSFGVLLCFRLLSLDLRVFAFGAFMLRSRGG